MFVVLTKVIFTPEVEDEVLALAEKSRPIAERQPGLIAMTQHLAQDRSHMMTYWRWQREDDHLNCMASPDWAEFNARWEALIESGKMRFELATYDVIG